MEICPKCNHIISWNSYFQAWICENCDFMSHETRPELNPIEEPYIKVIFCKDCKLWDKEGSFGDIGKCFCWDYYTNEVFFCGNAVRREEWETWD